MKKILPLALAAAVIFSSCGTISNLGPSTEGQKFQDGIYAKAPALKSKAEENAYASESAALVEKTKGSTIYLFGDKKDTVFIPKNMAATISFNSDLGTTVTVSDYDWRYDSAWDWYSPYTPYSIGSSWYWSRHWNPWYWNTWAYTPWHHSYTWYSPWYSSIYDPWFHDPWMYGFGGWYGYGGWYGFHGPHYCGWYGAWDPFWPGYHHWPHPGYIPEHENIWRGSRHQTGSDKVFAGRTSSRGGLGTSSTSRRDLTSSDSRTLSKGSSVGSTRAVRTAGSNRSTAVAAPGRTGVRGTAVRSPQSAQSGSASQVSRSSNYRRPAATSPAGSSSSYGRGTATSSSRSSVSGSGTSNHDRSNSSYSRSGSSSTTRSSSYSTGSTSRSSSSFGGGYSGGSRSTGSSGGGMSRSGGSSGARR